MTFKEAEKWAAIMLTVDNGCSVCIRNVVKKANETFPEFEFIYDEDAKPYPGTIAVRNKK